MFSIAQRNFKVIFFAMDKELRGQKEEEWQGSTHSVKSHIDNIQNVNIETANQDEEDRKAAIHRQEAVNLKIMEMAE